MNKEEKTPLLETINLKKYFKTGSGICFMRWIRLILNYIGAKRSV